MKNDGYFFLYRSRLRTEKGSMGRQDGRGLEDIGLCLLRRIRRGYDNTIIRFKM